MILPPLNDDIRARMRTLAIESFGPMASAMLPQMIADYEAKLVRQDGLMAARDLLKELISGIHAREEAVIASLNLDVERASAARLRALDAVQAQRMAGASARAPFEKMIHSITREINGLPPEQPWPNAPAAQPATVDQASASEAVSTVKIRALRKVCVGVGVHLDEGQTAEIAADVAAWLAEIGAVSAVKS